MAKLTVSQRLLQEYKEKGERALKEKPDHIQFIDIEGHVYGELTVIGFAGRINKTMYWVCLCACGNFIVKNTGNLRRGRSRYCYRKLHVGKSKSYTKLYKVWTSMKQRCFNEKSASYPMYGGRGIKMHPEWAKNYESFKKWSLENGYKEGLSIDRRNDGDYIPSECRWTDRSTQSANQRMQKTNTSGFLGVFKTPTKWESKIQWKGKVFFVGTFFSKIEAAKARDKMIIKNGWPHKLNFDQDGRYNHDNK